MKPSAGRRVVVTGIGLVTPLGIGTEATWRALLAGRSGIAPIRRFDPTGLLTRFAGEVPDWDPDAFIEPRKRREMSRVIELAIGASVLAWQDSGLSLSPTLAERSGCVLGNTMGALDALESSFAELATHGSLSPYQLLMAAPSHASSQVAIRLGLRGISYMTNSACASSVHAIGESARAIQQGTATVMVTGGCEAWVHRLAIASFNAVRALSLANDAPESASRPWDMDRSGFVMGEGAGVLVLEEREHAIARGAPIYCEVSGYGVSNDAFHLTQPLPDGAERSMRNAIEDAQIDPSAVRYINAHATSTPLGDLNEVRAIRAVFGAHADSIPVSASKSMLGHLGGAAGAVETAVTALSIRDGRIHPTAHLVRPGKGCDLDFVQGAARTQAVPVALTSSFGFGGTNTSLVLSHPDVTA